MAATVTTNSPPGPTDAGEKDRMAHQVAGVPVAVTDQGPSLSTLTGRTCTSYWVPFGETGYLIIQSARAGDPDVLHDGPVGAGPVGGGAFDMPQVVGDDGRLHWNRPARPR